MHTFCFGRINNKKINVVVTKLVLHAGLQIGTS